MSSSTAALEGLEPVSGAREARVERPQGGVELTVSGRRVRLAGVPVPAGAMRRALSLLGPGLIAAAAGNDAGGIATYAATGARYGYQAIWAMLLLTVALGLVQETCARVGSATGRGLLDLVRERFGLGPSLLLIGFVLLANAGVCVTEFVGLGAAAELLGISRYVAVPLAGGILWYVVLYGSYPKLERLLVLMTLVFFAYPVAAVLAHPDWGEVARGSVAPHVSTDREFLFLLVALAGTTMTPYMQIFQTSAAVEKGAVRKGYGPQRWDAYIGSAFSNFIAIAIMVATGATLHVAGKTEIHSAADAAMALQPLVGDSARLLFGLGLLGATLVAGTVLPLTTAYAVSEVFGFSKGVNLDYRRAPIFFRLFTALLVFGAGLALVPNLPLMPVLVGVQVLNGALLPLMLIVLMLLANDTRLMGELRNSRLVNVLGWAVTLMILVAVLALLVQSVT